MSQRKDESREEYLARERERAKLTYQRRRDVLLKHWADRRVNDESWRQRQNEYSRRYYAEHHPGSQGRPVPLTKEERQRRRTAYARNRYRSDAAHRRHVLKENTRRNPTISMAGELIRLYELPAELRPIAQLIRQTRQELRKRTG